jgi:nitroreductase
MERPALPLLNLSPDELLTTTRSVRKRLNLDKPVPLSLIEECLEIALQAPSASNLQSWQWMVVTDRSARTKIATFYKRAYDTYAKSPSSAHRQFPNDPTRSMVQHRVSNSAAWLADRIQDVPVLVIACLRVEHLSSDSQADLWGSVLPAAWSYMLAARARGLGTAWTTLHLDFEREIAALLNMPDNVRQGVLIPTAYYTGDTFGRAPRQPLHTVLHVNEW